MTSKKNIIWLFPFIVFAVAFIQYVNTIRHDYAWDDKLVITGNEYTTKGVNGLYDIFTKRVSVPYKSEYRPVPQAIFAIEYDLFNKSPLAGHLFNLIWYALTCVLVYQFIGFTFPHLHRLFPFLVALLFAVHPLHVEVVANIKSRDEILALFFGLSSVLLSVNAIEKKVPSLAVGALLCFILAFLSKMNAVTLLPIIALVLWYRSKTITPSRQIIAAAVLIAVVSFGLIALIRHLQSTVSESNTINLNSTVLNNIFLWSAQADLIQPTRLTIVGRYIVLFLYPHPLIHLYGYNQIPMNHWTDFTTLMVIVGLLALTLVLIKTWRKKSILLFATLFFFITYSVYSNLFFFAPDTMADRYMFIPSLALAIIFVNFIYWLARLDPYKPELKTARTRCTLALYGILLTAYGIRTYIANKDWENDNTLIYNRIAYMENNAAAQAIYGYSLHRESLEDTTPKGKQEKKAAAMRAFTKAIEIYPDFYAAWIFIGKLFAEEKIYDKAELSFLKAQQIEPLNADAYFYMGTLLLVQTDLNVAIPYLEKAVLLDPKMEEAYVMLGKAYLQSHHVDNLGAMTSTARQWFPNNIELEAQLAMYYFLVKRYDEATLLARSVISKDPQNILALTILSATSTSTF